MFYRSFLVCFLTSAFKKRRPVVDVCFLQVALSLGLSDLNSSGCVFLLEIPEKWLGVVAHASNPSTLGGQVGQIT